MFQFFASALTQYWLPTLIGLSRWQLASVGCYRNLQNNCRRVVSCIDFPGILCDKTRQLGRSWEGKLRTRRIISSIFALTALHGDCGVINRVCEVISCSGRSRFHHPMLVDVNLLYRLPITICVVIIQVCRRFLSRNRYHTNKGLLWIILIMYRNRFRCWSDLDKSNHQKALFPYLATI